MADLSVKIGQLQMKNPVMTASGTFGYGEEYADFMDISKIGGIIVKGTTLHKREGNPYPRMAETPSGMVNAVGLQNKGVDYFVEHIYPRIKDIDTQMIVNVSGSAIEDYVATAARINELEHIPAIELNISCPNVDAGGMTFGTDPAQAAQVTRLCRAATKRPLIVKLTPNVTDVTLIAQHVADAGADALSLINTLLGMAVDARTRRPKLARVVGGLSGPAVKPVALRMVWQVHQAVELPILGMGGIMTAEDAIEFMLCGATAVALGTVNFVNPHAGQELVRGIEQYCIDNGVADVNELVGALQA